VNCVDRQDQILLYAAGALEPEESAELRAHLATGCPRCAGALADAEATLTLLTQGLSQHAPPLDLRNKILNQAAKERKSEEPALSYMPWERIVIPSALAAVLAVAITLFCVRYLSPMLGGATLAQTQAQLVAKTVELQGVQATLALTQRQLADATSSLQGMKFAKMTGDPQPSAVAHVFLDLNHKKWYFFTNGMKPPANGKTYEFWVCVGAEKLPAGTFEVSDNGIATLHGDVPPIPPGANVMLCVTDEPMGGTQVPTGTAQLMGTVE
jgi:anti-sigma-K factor RskA